MVMLRSPIRIMKMTSDTRIIARSRNTQIIRMVPHAHQVETYLVVDIGRDRIRYRSIYVVVRCFLSRQKGGMEFVTLM